MSLTHISCGLRRSINYRIIYWNSMRKTSTVRPQTVETAFNSFRQKSHIINFDIVECEDGTFEYESVIIEPGQFDRDHIIAAIIRSRYDRNSMEAIQNNFLRLLLANGRSTPDITEEFRQMEAWRETAKSIADDILK